MSSDRPSIIQIMEQHEAPLLAEWMKLQSSSLSTRADLISAADLQAESAKFLSLVRSAANAAGTANIKSPAWQPVRDFITELSRTRAKAGFTPSETATFIFSLKQPLFDRLSKAHANDPARLVREFWDATLMLDALGMQTAEAFQAAREEVISRQQDELMELSTPVVTLWDGVLALPLIGVLDSGRTQTVMEGLLQRIVETGAQIAILDITGVATVDTLVAQHLMKTVAAARLMGADCFISGIRPQIAQTIVHLGVDLGNITTKATLAEALRLAIDKLGMKVVRKSALSGAGQSEPRPVKSESAR
ncbi:MAG: STAS domain-containing protein [Phycisphaerales bacterium]